MDPTWEIRFVRGPLTSGLFGDARFITDPALYVGRYVKPDASVEVVGLIPYFRSNYCLWQQIAQKLGATVISPRTDVLGFMNRLANVSFVFTESLHGAILADSIRIPWRPVASFSRVWEGDTNTFKRTDWRRSMSIQ